MRNFAVLSLFASITAFAQPAKPPSFEVASISATQPGQESIEFGPASLTMKNVRLTACIGWAYGVQDFQITGPSWLNDVWFDIFAKTANAATVAELRQMLQTLLADRFKLAVHRDVKEMTTYVLTVGKSGHKLQPVDVEGSPSFKTGKLNLTGQGATLAQLTEFLSKELREPVVDRTGLTGRFNYFLNIEPYFTEEMRKSGGPDGGPPPDGASIVATAIQGQLGLKLESKKAPVEMIVVEHAEKAPTEN